MTTRTALAGSQFGTTDTHLTPIALGAMIFGTSTPEGEARRILDHFIGKVTPRYAAPDGSAAQGMIDTADCYCWWEAPGETGGHSESLLGRWFVDSGERDRVFLATKATGMLTSYDGVWLPDGGGDWSIASKRWSTAEGWRYPPIACT